MQIIQPFFLLEEGHQFEAQIDDIGVLSVEHFFLVGHELFVIFLELEMVAVDFPLQLVNIVNILEHCEQVVDLVEHELDLCCVF